MEVLKSKSKKRKHERHVEEILTVDGATVSDETVEQLSRLEVCSDEIEQANMITEIVTSNCQSNLVDDENQCVSTHCEGQDEAHELEDNIGMDEAVIAADNPVFSADVLLALVTPQPSAPMAVAHDLQTTTISEKDHVSAASSAVKKHVSAAVKRVYPTLETCAASTQIVPQLQPLSEAQLHNFYRNAELEACEDFEYKFVEVELVAPSEDDVFYRLLCSFLAACRRLEQCRAEILDLKAQFESSKSGVWALKQHSIVQKGKCGEDKTASGSANYENAQYCPESASRLSESLKAARECLCEKVCHSLFQRETARMVTQSYVARRISAVITGHRLPIDAPPVLLPDSPVSEAQQSLRLALRTLFFMIRQPALPGLFQENVEVWILNMASTLLRVAVVADHFHLLCHLLRCPSSVADWSAGLVQPCLQGAMTREHFIDHFLAMLWFVMNPVRKREQFLSAFIRHELTKADDAWTLVSPDGDVVEERTLVEISEAVLINFLNQFSFDQLFLWLLDEHSAGSSCYVYDTTVLKMFALELTVLKILYSGLHSYSSTRYRQFCKQIGYQMRQTVQYIGEYWSKCRSILEMQVGTEQHVEKLQLEFDRLFFRAVHYIVFAKSYLVTLYNTHAVLVCMDDFSSHECMEHSIYCRLGIWQFIVDLPYGSVAPSSLWRCIYTLLNFSSHLSSSDILASQHQDIISQIQDAQVLQMCLVELQESDAVYLLNALANIACATQDRTLVDFVVEKLFYVCFVSDGTRQNFYKTGRQLFSSLVVKHTRIFSNLVALTDQHVQQADTYVVDLWTLLPVELFKLNETDVDILKEWIQLDLYHIANRVLSRRILLGVTWGDIDKSVHMVVAEILIEAHMKHCPKQHMQNALKTNPNAQEVHFDMFCWNVLSLLDVNGAQDLKPLDSLLKVIANGMEKSDLIALYMALETQQLTRSLPDFENYCVNLLEALTRIKHYRPALLVLCRFVQHEQAFGLAQNAKFHECLKSLAHADEGYVQYAKSFVFPQEPGHWLQLLAAVISTTLKGCSNNQRGAEMLVQFWIACLARCAWKGSWTNDFVVCHLLNCVVECAFVVDPQLSMCRQALRLEFEKAATQMKPQNKGVWSWITGSQTGATPFLDTRQFSRAPWLAYACVQVEDDICRPLQDKLELQMMRQPSMTVPDALKKVMQKQHVPGWFVLPVLRWCELAVALSSDNPVLVLVVQHLFMYLLRRVTVRDDPSLPTACLGQRYMRSTLLESKMDSLKRLLVEASRNHDTSGQQTITNSLRSLFRAMVEWLDDQRLFSPYTDVSQLPVHECRQFLELLVRGSTEPWLDLVFFQPIADMIDTRCATCMSQLQGVKSPKGNARSAVMTDTLQRMRSSTSAVSRMQERASQGVHNVKSPPSLPVPELVVPLVPTATLLDGREVKFAAQPWLDIIRSEARLFVDVQATLVRYDMEFEELLPTLYHNVPTQISIVLECKPGYRQSCQSPNTVRVKVDKAFMKDHVNLALNDKRSLAERASDQLEKIASGRLVHSSASLMQLMNDLVALASHPTSVGERRESVLDSGVCLFYHVVAHMSGHILHFGPTMELFERVLDELGQHFLANNALQVTPIFNHIVQQPMLCRFLVDNFTPNCVDVKTFVELYSLLFDAVRSAKLPPDVAFVLLSKLNVDHFLPACNVSEGEVLLQVSHCAVVFCNSNAKTLFDIYHLHWTSCFTHRFPVYFIPVVKMLIDASCTNECPVVLWNTLLERIGAAVRPLHPDDHVFTVPPQLILECLKYLTEFFRVRKEQSHETMQRGLFGAWRLYVPPLSCFFHYLCTTLVYCSGTDANNVMVAEEVVGDLWNMFRTLFAPWIEPCPLGVRMHAPFGEDQIELADQMFHVFVGALSALFTKFERHLPPNSNHVVALFWSYYAQTLATDKLQADHVFKAYNTQFVCVACVAYYITVRKGQMSERVNMLQLLRSGPSLSHTFITDVVVRIPWPTILQYYESLEPPLARAAFLGMLLEIAVRCAANDANFVNCKLSFPNLLELLCGFPWHYVAYQRLESIVSWVITGFSSNCLITGQDSIQACALRLIKYACFFDAALHPSSTSFDKQTLYLKLWTHFLVVYANDSRHIAFHVLGDRFTEAMAEIEIFARDWQASKTVTLTEVYRLTESLLGELVLFWNLVTPTRPREIVTRACFDWLTQHADAMLVLPFVAVTSRSLTEVACMAHFVEQCVEIYFNGSMQATMAHVVGAFSLQEHSSIVFRQHCIDTGNLLALYVFYMKRLEKCQQLSDETVVLRELLGIVIKAKEILYPDPKLMLFLHQIVLLFIRQFEFGGSQLSFGPMLHDFAEHLKFLAEDRASWLGSVFSKKPTYVPRFRLVCAVMCAFLSQQFLDENWSVIRLEPNLPILNPQIESVKKLKITFKSYASLVDDCGMFLNDPTRHLGSTHELLTLLSRVLYSERYVMNVVAM